MKSFLPGILLLLLQLHGLSQTKESFSVYFDFDKYSLTSASLAQIDSFFRSNNNIIPSIQFELKGYCDNRGADKYNIDLSEKRVATVKNYLLKKGINNEFILSALGFGETEPLNENKTEVERQLNRRVDIFIIKNAASTSAANRETPSLKQKIADSATTAGTNIVLRNINFVGARHQLLPESQPMLNELLDAMRTYPKLVIRIEGHVCCLAGSGDGNDEETNTLNLSETRAKAIYDYLIEKGIVAKRLSYKGFGHSAPIYPFPEQTEEERIQNRRVEIKIISK